MATLLAALTDDLIEEFLVRLPPEDPTSLVCAALVCRRWRRILADHGFRRRFCEHHHRRPPMLGFFHDTNGKTRKGNPHMFTPTSSFRPCIRDLSLRFTVGARHGRVLLGRKGYIINPSASRLAVWDPITNDPVNLPRSPWLQTPHFSWRAVLLCASTPSDSCDHLDCNSRPFLVVFVGSSKQQGFAYVYSSQAGVWSHTASAAWEGADHYPTLLYEYGLGCNAVARNAIYFRLRNDIRILKYDLGAQEISTVDLPPGCHQGPQILLTATQDGRLDVGSVDMPRIHLWSIESSPDLWAPAGVIGLGTVCHANPFPFSVVDIMHSLGAIIFRTCDGVLFSVDIESKWVIKLCEGIHIAFSVPYMSFCTPALGVSKYKKKKKKKSNTSWKN